MIPAQLQQFLDQLHDESLKQEASIPSEQLSGVHAQMAQDIEEGKKNLDSLMLDKFIALDKDKSLFIYQLLLAKGATAVVEAGTSFGVSTIYLALAAHANAQRNGGKAKVIATEKEASKAARAQEIWKQCGSEVEHTIELRVGDLEQTLKEDFALQDGQYVDALLLDIWPYMALPALKLVQPRMKPGSVVITDNSLASAGRYKDLMQVLRNPEGPWISITLPFTGGLEFSVYSP